MILVFRMLSFKPTFLFHFHQEALYFITFCHKYGDICMRLLIFLPAVLLPTCASSSPSLESCNLSRAKDKSAFQILIYVIWIALIASFTCLLLIVGFPGSASAKEPAWMQETRDGGSVPGVGRPPVEGNGNPLQYSCLENPMDRGTGGLQSGGGHKIVLHVLCLLWSIFP